MDEIAEAVGGFDGPEEPMVREMLARGYHPKAILNKINADRYGPGGW